MDDLLLIDKPVGITSFAVIRQLRPKLGIKKIGHAGTLDPLASGLMILGVGAGTKKLTKLIKLDKEYLAEILIGEKRSTGDMEGEIIESVSSVNLTPKQLIEAINSLTGTQTLPVSAYSAIKIAGTPLYKLARKAKSTGQTVTDLPIRQMIVHSTKLENIEVIFSDQSKTVVNRLIVKVKFFVGSGTYIRSLAEELGNRLGYPATLYSLRRTKVGEFDLKDAKQISDY